MKPATSSDSASGRSNGGRLVSARADMMKHHEHRQQGQPIPVQHRGRQAHFRADSPVFCALTMSVMLSEPTHNRTVTMTRPIETS